MTRQLLSLSVALTVQCFLPFGHALLTGLKFSVSDVAAGSIKYVIATFPTFGQINYMKLPDPSWRPLLPSKGLVEPKAICVDIRNKRLYVADPAAGMVYWYQLLVMPDFRLLSDGRKRLAVANVAADGLAIDGLGNLYVAGRTHAAVSVEGIFKQDVKTIEKTLPKAPRSIWTGGNARLLFPNGTVNTLASPVLFQPGSVAVSAFQIYWGNKLLPVNGTVLVQANIGGPPPAPSPAVMASSFIIQERYAAMHNGAMRPITDAVPGIMGIALTPTSLLYATKGGVYGINLNDVPKGCGANNILCPLVAEASDPTGMVWDGDGTIYVADRMAGAVFSFPAGAMSKQTLVKASDAKGVFSVALFETSAARQLGRCAVILAIVVNSVTTWASAAAV